MREASFTLHCVRYEQNMSEILVKNTGLDVNEFEGQCLAAEIHRLLYRVDTL